MRVRNAMSRMIHEAQDKPLHEWMLAKYNDAIGRHDQRRMRSFE